MISEYNQVGQSVEYGDTLVTYDDVEPLRMMAATELMLAAKYVRTEVTDESDALRYAFYLRPIDPREDAISKHVSVRLLHWVEPERWQLAIRERKLNGQDRESGKWTDYRFESILGDLSIAKKEVYVMRGRREMGVRRGGVITETLTSSRTMFERPLEVGDCKSVYDMLQRTLKRARVSAR